MQLGYVIFEVSDVAAWDVLLSEVIGMVGDGTGRYRMDGRPWRVQVQEGPADDLVCVGWELPSLDGIVFGEEVDGASRGVAALRRGLDPAGVPTELALARADAPTPFRSPLVRHGFVADVCESDGTETSDVGFLADFGFGH